MIPHEILPLALAELGVATDRRTVRVQLTARPHVLRLRRQLPSSASERVWVLELEVEVPAIDPERLLGGCEEFLVDGSDGRKIGVVERVVKSQATGATTALLISAGWFGRRRLRIDAQGIEAVIPAERRVIVDESRLASPHTDAHRA